MKEKSKAWQNVLFSSIIHRKKRRKIKMCARHTGANACDVVILFACVVRWRFTCTHLFSLPAYCSHRTPVHLHVCDCVVFKIDKVVLLLLLPATTTNYQHYGTLDSHNCVCASRILFANGWYCSSDARPYLPSYSVYVFIYSAHMFSTSSSYYSPLLRFVAFLLSFSYCRRINSITVTRFPLCEAHKTQHLSTPSSAHFRRCFFSSPRLHCIRVKGANVCAYIFFCRCFPPLSNSMPWLFIEITF